MLNHFEYKVTAVVHRLELLDVFASSFSHLSRVQLFPEVLSHLLQLLPFGMPHPVLSQHVLYSDHISVEFLFDLARSDNSACHFRESSKLAGLSSLCVCVMFLELLLQDLQVHFDSLDQL